MGEGDVGAADDGWRDEPEIRACDFALRSAVLAGGEKLLGGEAVDEPDWASMDEAVADLD